MPFLHVASLAWKDDKSDRVRTRMSHLRLKAVFLDVQSSRKGSVNAKFPLKMFLKLETKFLDSTYDQIVREPLRVIKKLKLGITGNMIIELLPKLLLWTQ